MKKLFRKIAAVVMAAAMLPAIPASAVYKAEKAPKDWTVSYTGMEGDKANLGSITYAQDMGKDDNYSFKAVGSYSWSDYQGNVKMELKSNTFNVPAGQYTYSISVKSPDGVNTHSGDMHTEISGALSGTIIASLNENDSRCMDSKTESEDGWITYTKAITLTEKTGTYINIKFLSQPNMYIDNVSLKDSSGKEYVPNGTFTEYVVSESDLYLTPYRATGWVTALKSGSEYTTGLKTAFESDYYAAYSRSEGRNGGGAMHIKRGLPEAYKTTEGKTSYYWWKNAVTVTTPEIATKAGSKYKIIAYYKGKQDVHMRQLNQLSEVGAYGDLVQLSNWTLDESINEGTDVWYKKSTTFTAKYDNERISFCAVNTTDMYLDDVSVYAVDESGSVTGENLIANGDFDSYYEIDPKPVRLLGYSAEEHGGTDATITWYNPSDAVIENIKMTVNGTETEIKRIENVTKDTENKVNVTYTTGADLGAGAFNEAVLTGLTVGAKYEVKVEITANGKTASDTVDFVARSGKFALGAWEIERVDGITAVNAFKADGTYSGGYMNTIASLVDGGYNSSRALKIVSNRQEYKNHTSFRLDQLPENLNASKKYELSYYAKYDKTSGEVLRAEYYYKKSDGTSQQVAVTVPTETDAENGWKKYTYTIGGKTDVGNNGEITSLRVLSVSFNGTVVIDDVSLYELDTVEEDPMGDNLITDGGFEFDGVVIATEPKLEYYVENDWQIVKDYQGNGQYKASAAVINYSEEDFTPALVFAVYKDGVLKDVIPVETDVPMNDWAATDIGTGEITVSDADTIKVMLWDGLSSIVPLTGALVAAQAAD